MRKAVLATVLLALSVPLDSQTRGKLEDLRGTVTDESGGVIRSAYIFINRKTPWGDKVELAAQSDETGKFVLHLPTGAYDIFVTAFPFSAQAQTISCSPQEVTWTHAGS